MDERAAMKIEGVGGPDIVYGLGVVIVSLGSCTKKKYFTPWQINDVAATFGLDIRKDFVDELTGWFRGAVESIIDENNEEHKDALALRAVECAKEREQLLESVKREHPEIGAASDK